MSDCLACGKNPVAKSEGRRDWVFAWFCHACIDYCHDSGDSGQHACRVCRTQLPGQLPNALTTHVADHS